MTVYEEKRSFICTRLAPMVMTIDEEIVNVRYAIRESEELVIITYKDRNWTKEICVTADSLIAIARDVLNHI